MALLHSMETPNPCHEYKFSWKIGNFSKTPVNFDGPSFSPIPEKKGTFCFRFEFLEKNPTDKQSRIRVYLKTLDDYDENINVGSCINLLDSDNQLWKGQKTKVMAIDTITLLMDRTFSYSTKDILSQWCLGSDILIVEGKLSLFAYNTTSKACEDKTTAEARDELANNLKSMYKSGFSSDVTLTVGDSSLPAHKAILASRSPVFAKMFDQDMLERNSNVVVIEDAQLHVFECFLMFLYTGVLEDKTWDTVFPLYSLADKYQMPSLRKMCSEILGKNLTVNSACSGLLLSDLHEDDKLKKKVNEFIADNLEVLGTKEWADFVVTKPQLVENVMSFLKWCCSSGLLLYKSSYSSS